MSNVSEKTKNKRLCHSVELTLSIVILSRKKRSEFAYLGPLGNSEFQLNFIGISGALAFLFRHIMNITQAVLNQNNKNLVGVHKNARVS